MFDVIRDFVIRFAVDQLCGLIVGLMIGLAFRRMPTAPEHHNSDDDAVDDSVKTLYMKNEGHNCLTVKLQKNARCSGMLRPVAVRCEVSRTRVGE